MVSLKNYFEKRRGERVKKFIKRNCVPYKSIKTFLILLFSIVILISFTKYINANSIFEKANSGDAEAQFILGSMYVRGIEVGKDINKAIIWFTKAAQQGHSNAQTALGMIYYYKDSSNKDSGIKQDIKKAIKWFMKAADQGNSVAQFHLGLIYVEGEDIKQDYNEAMKWFRKAALSGNPKAQFNLGLMYAKGTGVKQDLNEAKKWFKKAAEQGEVRAQQILKEHFE